MKFKFPFVSLLIVSFVLMLSSFLTLTNKRDYTANELPYFLRATDAWAKQQLDSLSLKDKIAQSLMIATWPKKGQQHQQEMDSIIQQYRIGGIIVFQGNRKETKEVIAHYQSISKLPLLVGMDAEWGSAMRMSDAVRFPFQLTMGAADDPVLTEKIAQQMAYEIGELGVHMNFSPVADVNSNPNNPVINFRSFGENAGLVGRHTHAMVRGMERNGMLTCLKHFPGHGDTDKDSHYELPTVSKSLQELNLVDWTPFKMGRLAGASAVMMAHLQVPALDSSNTPSSLSEVIIQDYLRKQLKFNGLIISDALNMKAVSDRYGKVEVAVKAYQAGNDILLYPESVKGVIDAIYQKVQLGEISMEVVNEKCFRILAAKAHVNNHTKQTEKFTEREMDVIHSSIYEKALTVLKNENDAIPLASHKGEVALISLGKNSGAFVSRMNDYLEFTHISGEDVTSVQNQLNNHSKSFEIVVFNVHASSILPKNNYSYPKDWMNLMRELKGKYQLIINLFGNPYVIQTKEMFDGVDAVVIAFEQSQYGEDRAAQLVAGGFSSVGKLPVSLFDAYSVGDGVITPKASRLKFIYPEELGVSVEKLAEIDKIVENGITQKAYPGCQVVAAKDGKVFYRKAFGKLTYEDAPEVNNETVYDLASITKVVSSTTALMSLEDNGKMSLSNNLGQHLPELTGETPFGKLVLKDVMAHQAGLSPWIPFYTKTLVNGKPNPELYSNTFSDSFALKVAPELYLKTDYEDEMYRQILATTLKLGKNYKYSDVGYYFTKEIIEKSTEQSLDDYVHSSFYLPMGLQSMRYNPLNFYGKENIAPTERDNYFRHQLVQGYVHDMGAAMTNGVGGHAGVFSTATDLAAFMQLFLNKGVYGGYRYLSEKVINDYTSCQFCPRNRRGAGFDKPVRNLEGGPTCNLVSLSSFGHTGFTGTMAWADPDHGVNYVFLSNRVYPSADNWKLVKMGIRTDIQKVIYEALKDVP